MDYRNGLAPPEPAPWWVGVMLLLLGGVVVWAIRDSYRREEARYAAEREREALRQRMIAEYTPPRQVVIVERSPDPAPPERPRRSTRERGR